MSIATGAGARERRGRAQGLHRAWSGLTKGQRLAWTVGVLLGGMVVMGALGPFGIVLFLAALAVLAHVAFTAERQEQAHYAQLRDTALSVYSGPDAPAVTEIFVPPSWSARRRAFSAAAPPSGTAIALDADRSRVWLAQIDPRTRRISRHGYGIREILDAELREQTETLDETSSQTRKDKTVTKASTGGLIGRAVVGKAAAGPLGGAAGALTAKRTTSGGHETTTSTARTTTMVHSVRLHLKLDDPSNPLATVEFLDKPAAQTSPEYRDARELAERWFALVELLMRRSSAP